MLIDKQDLVKQLCLSKLIFRYLAWKNIKIVTLSVIKKKIQSGVKITRTETLEKSVRINDKKINILKRCPYTRFKLATFRF